MSGSPLAHLPLSDAEPARRGGGTGSRPGLFLVFNAAIVLCALAARSGALPGPLRMLGAALLVLVLPGAAWLGLFKRRPLDPPRLFLALAGISSAASLLGVCLVAVATRLWGGADPVGQASALIGLAADRSPQTGFAARWPAILLAWEFLVVNAGLALAGRPRPLDRARWKLLTAVAAAGFLTTSLAAVDLVPPLEDHDMEVRGTAVGLLATGKPYFLTNRQLWFQFSHPILFHFPVAESLVFTGEILDASPSFISARRAEKTVEEGGTVRWDDLWRADYELFVKKPALAGTRAPSALFSSMVLALIVHLVAGMTASAAAGLSAGALYASTPETIVRSAYAGYFSQSVFAMLVASMLFAGSRRLARPVQREALGDAEWGWFVAAGAFAALVDHKTVVMVLGVAGLALTWAAFGLATRRTRAEPLLDRRAIALGAGFASGTLVWWVYGLSVHAALFVRDHLRMHIAHRMLMNDIRLAHDPGRYAPSMGELWKEFSAHTGWLFLPVAIVGIAAWAAAAAAPGARTRADGDLRAVLAAWCLVGSVAFTLTDWRQTKHLMNQLAPMVAAAVTLAWPGAGSRRRHSAERADADGEPPGHPGAGSTRSPGAGVPSRAPGAGGSGSWVDSAPVVSGTGSSHAPAAKGFPRAADATGGRGSTLLRVTGGRWVLAVAVGAALAAALTIDLAADARLISDFRTLTISGASDIDGW